MIAGPRNQSRSRKAPSSGSLSRYDNASFAVCIESGQTRRVLRGTAHYQRDDVLGGILRITLSGDCPGRPEIIVAEDEWNGLIVDGRAHGCDYCLMLIPDEPRGRGAYGPTSGT